jgi:hypothetical protein
MSAFECIAPVSADTLPVLLSVADRSEFDDVDLTILSTRNKKRRADIVGAYAAQTSIVAEDIARQNATKKLSERSIDTESHGRWSHVNESNYAHFAKDHIDSGGFLLKISIGEDTDPGSVMDLLWEEVNIIQARDMPAPREPDMAKSAHIRLAHHAAAFTYHTGRFSRTW